MAKLTKEELASRIDGLEIDDELKISLMEDISDSITPEENADLESIKAELEEAKAKYDDLKIKYKERFMSVVDVEEKEEEVPEMEEKEVIDITEI